MKQVRNSLGTWEVLKCFDSDAILGHCGDPFRYEIACPLVKDILDSMDDKIASHEHHDSPRERAVMRCDEIFGLNSATLVN